MLDRNIVCIKVVVVKVLTTEESETHTNGTCFSTNTYKQLSCLIIRSIMILCFPNDVKMGPRLLLVKDKKED